MTLQGPHQVAKASRTTTLLLLMADSNSALLLSQRVSICASDGRERAELKGADVPCDIVDTHVDGC